MSDWLEACLDRIEKLDRLILTTPSHIPSDQSKTSLTKARVFLIGLQPRHFEFEDGVG